MVGQDIAILLKLSLQKQPRVLSKQLASDLFLSAAEVSNSLRRSQAAGLLFRSDAEKRVNISALIEFLSHGLRYVFPPERGTLRRGIPTAVAAKPLSDLFVDNGEPPDVWPHPEGTVRGLSFSPLYKNAAQAALLDPKLYELLALCDAIRGGRTRERAAAIEYLEKALYA